MRKGRINLVTFLIANMLSICAFAQNVTVSGVVQNSVTAEKSSAVSVTVQGTDLGTYTDDKGAFSLNVKSLPATLIFSSIGFKQQSLVVTSSVNNISIKFEPTNSLGQEVVVSASRVPQKILESPVSIERVSAAALRNAPAVNFYDVVATLKGVDITTSSLTFKTPTTRGFGGSGNVRFNQLVDGMDNQAPGLNFSVGAIIGLNELDIDNIELLSGASSALYGPGGTNGTLLMTSKNPFKYQGLSFVVKQGVMHTDERQRPTSPYYNLSLRWGKKVSEKFAFKMVTELIQAKDWIGTDYRNYNRTGMTLKPGSRQTDPNFDGVNVYGDETSGDIRAVLNNVAGAAPFLAPFIRTLTTKAINVSRTGYTEQELLNPNTVNFKLGGSLHYKIGNNTEASVAGYWGTGNTVYTGASRYSIKDFKMGQYKAELINKNWLLRAYTTQENAGNSFNIGATSQNFNEAWKKSVDAANPANGWFAQYGQAFLQGKLSGQSDFDAHQAARAVADVGRPLAGTTSFKARYDSVARIPVPKGGGLLDRSDLYNVEGNYNFSSITSSVADILVGGNYRKYVLNSQGTLFADTAGPIGIREFGAYIQASRDLGAVKLTASGRYDKNQNFKGRFTPRVTAVVKAGDNSNIRLSYQTAYRFPSTQQQWINLDLVSYKLIGGNEAFRTIYNFDRNPVYDRDSLRGGKTVALPFQQLKPEALSSFELGYKSLIADGKLLIDAYGYAGQYTDFLARRVVVQSKTNSPITLGDTSLGQVYSIPVNSTGKIKSYGFGLGFDYRLPRNFTISANVASDNLTDVPKDIVSFFNSPKYKVNATLGNTGFGADKRMGFSVAYRWQDDFYYQGDLASGSVPHVTTLDAQLSYKLPTTKSILKLGANNLLNQYYYNAIGNSSVGGLYYISFGYNIY